MPFLKRPKINRQKILNSYKPEAGNIPVKAYMVQKTLRRREHHFIPSNNKPCPSAQPWEWKANKGERSSEAFFIWS